MSFLNRYEMSRIWLPTVKFYLFCSLILGFFYTLIVLMVANTFFYNKAQGSLIYCQNKICGSTLLGQEFNGLQYFWGRPSLTKYQYDWLSKEQIPAPYDKSWIRCAKNQKIKFEKDNLPAELLSPSASQVDPDVSLWAIDLQISRVAKARGLREAELIDFVHDWIEKPFLGIYGQERINVLRLNHALDQWMITYGQKKT